MKNIFAGVVVLNLLKRNGEKGNPKKTGEPRGLCKWCKDLNRSFFGGINK